MQTIMWKTGAMTYFGKNAYKHRDKGCFSNLLISLAGVAVHSIPEYITAQDWFRLTISIPISLHTDAVTTPAAGHILQVSSS